MAKKPFPMRQHAFNAAHQRATELWLQSHGPAARRQRAQMREQRSRTSARIERERQAQGTLIRIHTVGKKHARIILA